MKSIYGPRKEFIHGLQVWKDIEEALRKNGYTDYIIVISKEYPDDEESILFDTHYKVSEQSLVDSAKELIEKIEQQLLED